MSEDIFEQFSGDYDCWFEEHRAEYRAELARIRRLFPRPDSRALEVGVGSGRFAAPLGVPLGLEPSRALGRMARRRGIEVIRGRAESIPIRDGSCSSVLMVTVICFLDDPVPAFEEIHRILVPGGTLVLGFIEREGEVARKYLHEKGKHRFLSRARFYSSGEVRELLGRTGFSVMAIDSRAGFSVIAARKDR
ncbi:methyltransferase type 11 [Methanoculleus sediminis]|uniref:Methyltransferase type 11 n=1 Tax=Methanoculleus sediminis TaxID=1550566 RepID=A0A0H1QWB0_9EURY|nr:class I SAM-dependent methyltransferase [Methanoculleus sediminis]KLK87243.1 methyltransferase type 11 [Methanoculleus sediminis]